MICNKCLHSLYAQALSVGKCKVCGNPTPSPHIPSYTVCDKCSQEHRLCIQCAVRMDDEGDWINPERSD